MQQKVQFVATVLHQPTLLILDEPFSGLDPINAEIIKNEIFELQANGTTIIFSTHRMENVEEICEDIFLINDGKIILNGNVKAIKQQYKQHLIKVETATDSESNETIESQLEIVQTYNNQWLFKLKEHQTQNDILKVLLQQQIEILSMHEVLPTVNDIFIQKVKNEI